MKGQWLRTPGPSSDGSLRPAYHNGLNGQVSCKSDGRTKNGVRCHSQSQLEPRRYACRRESRTNRACVAKRDVQARSRDVHRRPCRRSVLHVKRRGRAMGGWHPLFLQPMNVSETEDHVDVDEVGRWGRWTMLVESHGAILGQGKFRFSSSHWTRRKLSERR